MNMCEGIFYKGMRRLVANEEEDEKSGADVRYDADYG
jgi:hypothetical protein